MLYLYLFTLYVVVRECANIIDNILRQRIVTYGTHIFTVCVLYRYYTYGRTLMMAADRKCGPWCVRGWKPTGQISGSHLTSRKHLGQTGTTSDNYFRFAAATV